MNAFQELAEFSLLIGKCVSVCVCVRDRKRKRESVCMHVVCVCGGVVFKYLFSFILKCDIYIFIVQHKESFSSSSRFVESRQNQRASVISTVFYIN